jgi:transposase-like protein
MDGDTRFLLANHLSQGRNVADAQSAFREAKATAKVERRVLLTDGLGSEQVGIANQEVHNY